MTVKSHHHQGVDGLGEGFVVTGWSVDDDVIEAIELPGPRVRARRPLAPRGGRPRSRGGRRRWSRRRAAEVARMVIAQVVEPATEQVIAEVPRAGVEETDAAVARAKEAFPAWRAVAPGDRAALLHRLADALEERGRGAGDARGAQRRQADRRRARRDGDGGRDLPLLRGRPRAAARPDDPRRRRRRHDLPRAARRRRPDRAVELPARDRVVEGRARRWRPATRSC